MILLAMNVATTGLIVEDGTGLPNAESYCSVAYANTRHSNLGNAAWAALSVPAREEALRRATQYMLQAYRQRWIGLRLSINQALDWPRWGVVIDEFYPVASNIVPADIARACTDLAFKAAAGDLAPDLTQGIIREKTGPIETEYNRGTPQYTRFRAIDMMLAPYLNSSGGMARLVRS